MNTGSDSGSRLLAGTFGLAMVVEQVADAHVQRICREGVIELLVKVPHHGGTLDWLDALPDLVGLCLSATRCVVDGVERRRVFGAPEWNCIRGLRNLRYLRLVGDATDELDLGVFPHLLSYSGPWWPGLRGLDVHPPAEVILMHPSARKGFQVRGDNLRRLWVHAPDMPDLAWLKGCSGLRELAVLGVSKMASTNGVEQLRSIEAVGLFGLTKLVDVSALAALPQLVRLRIDDCPRLASFRLAADAPLQVLQLVGRTSVADGQLRWLLSLPHLREVALAGKRHYDVSKADLPRAAEPGDGFFSTGGLVLPMVPLADLQSGKVAPRAWMHGAGG
ncbi:MAG: hypothetical protein MUC36_22450 [Planctomycetes bacterium]|jgi:hypothetical protein|nr:hypothetical protein [Planctomycetota bacterium]